MEGFLEGEVAIPEVADNFYAAPVIEVKESSIAAILLSVTGVLSFGSAILYVVVFRKQLLKKGFLDRPENFNS